MNIDSPADKILAENLKPGHYIRVPGTTDIREIKTITKLSNNVLQITVLGAATWFNTMRFTEYYIY